MTVKYVLIVDDNPIVRQVIVSLVHELGFNTVEADSASAAKTELSARNFDVLLCDDILGAGMSGSDFIDDNVLALPSNVILMSGNPRPATLSSRVRYLSKPFTILQLEAALTTGLN